MLERNYFSVLFFIKKTKLLKNGQAPICLRITVNGLRAEIQVKRSVAIDKWDAKKECCKAKDRAGDELNHYLQSVKTKVMQIHRQLEQDHKTITAEIIKKMFYGQYTPPKSLIEIFTEHNKRCRSLIGKDYVEETVQRFERTVTYLQEFMQAEYNISEIPLNQIKMDFIVKFEHFVKTGKKCSHNSALKYMKNLKKIILYALGNNWLETNPFVMVKFKNERTHREFLSEEEVKRLLTKEFEINRLEQVRDIFAFCCFTGLAFSDVQKLNKQHIYVDSEGTSWLRIARQKTDTMCNIPLIEVPLRLIEKYASHPECVARGTLLPVPSNQKMNSYLKEIADLCHIKRDLSTHMARHTFACMALANNMSIETIAKILGHGNIKTTAIYAKVLDSTVKKQMNNLHGKFGIMS